MQLPMHLHKRRGNNQAEPLSRAAERSAGRAAGQDGRKRYRGKNSVHAGAADPDGRPGRPFRRLRPDA
jgi:hypothetical protein